MILIFLGIVRIWFFKFYVYVRMILIFVRLIGGIIIFIMYLVINFGDYG